MPSFPFLTAPLQGDGVQLRDYAERDIPEILIAYQDDPRLHVRLGEQRPPSGAELGRRAEQEPAVRAAGTRAHFTILERDSDVCCGVVNVHKVDWEQARCELGIWIAPQARGRGLSRSALRRASEWLFETFGMQRVQVITEPDNESMLRSARAAGFVEEGVLRSYMVERGIRLDGAILSLLPSDL
jgi:RimJ/RimL family protein N-acetyltransferase